MTMRIRTLLCAMCALVLLSGCASGRQGYPSKESIQPGEEITVAPGDNVYAIAQKNGVSMREVIVLNDLRSPYTLKPGQTLTLPLKAGALPKTPSAAPLSAIQAVPLEPINSPVTAAPLSATQSPVSTTIAPQSSALSSPDLSLPPPLSTTPVKPLETTVPKSQVVASAEKEMTESSETTTTAEETSFSAIPPVQGPIISSFGSKTQGQSNDGINIGAPKGATVVAAAGGIVVYAGNEMKGFGNLILIRHEEGWVTAYAHLDRMLVNKDNVVAAGDQIGTVGTTGGVSVPQLHFETRYEGKPVDPQTVLKKAG